MFLLLSPPCMWGSSDEQRPQFVAPGNAVTVTAASQVDILHDLSWSCYILDFPRALFWFHTHSVTNCLWLILTHHVDPLGVDTLLECFVPHFPLLAFVNVAAAYLRLSFFKVYSSVAFIISIELCNLPKSLKCSSVCKNIFFDVDISWDRHYNFIPTTSGLWTQPYSFDVLASHTVSVGPGALALPSSSQVSVGGLSSRHYAKGPLYSFTLFSELFQVNDLFCFSSQGNWGLHVVSLLVSFPLSSKLVKTIHIHPFRVDPFWRICLISYLL